MQDSIKPSPHDSSLNAIEVRGLVKRYGDLQAVQGISFDVPKGQCLGLLGPNGAGKTTTIEILEGLRELDEGTISILGLEWGRSASQIRARIGVHLQETQLQDKLTVFETVRLFRSFYSSGKSADEVLDIVRLQEKRKDRVKNLSGGQKQRLALGCALVSDPEILFLDEPTTGLDPQARRRVWEIVEEFKTMGRTILLTTHYMDEAEKLSDNLIIIDQGKIISEGTPQEIIDSLGAQSILEFRLGESTPFSDSSLLESLPGVGSASEMHGWWRLHVAQLPLALNGLMKWIETQGLDLQDLRTHQPTLEDVFVNLTGRQLRDG